MKSIFFPLLLLLFSTNAFSQQTSNSSALTKQDFMQKSKNQRTIGLCLVASGLIAGTAGVVVALKDAAKEIINFPVNIITGSPAVEENNYSTELIIGGGMAIMSSIPLFIGSTKNRKKAMSMSFKNQMIPQLQSNSFVYRAAPSLNFKINL